VGHATLNGGLLRFENDERDLVPTDV